MKVIELKEFSLDRLTLTERPQPKPGAGEVLVRMHAASLNYRDVLIAKGLYPEKFQLPIVPVSDGAGEVVELGPGVKRFARGDRVATLLLQQWISGEASYEMYAQELGGPLDGVLREYAVFPDYGLVKAPVQLTYEETACLPIAAVTAWHTLTEGGTRAGDTVLIHGTGGVAIFALQFAKAMGAKVIITSSSDEKCARARQLSADVTLNYRSQPDIGNAVLDVTGGRGVDVVVETVGASTLKHSLAAIRLGGYVGVPGAYGPLDAEINVVTDLIWKCARVHGIQVGSRDQFEAMNRAIEANSIRPVIDQVFAFSEIKEALAYLVMAKHFGKIVIKI
jgi:NADPH:quinone reductase-like Zn-dependent oxidoreductase